MKSFGIEFPNPVLAADRDDYKEDCGFSISLIDNMSVDNENITINIEYSMQCNGIQSLIESGDVIVVIIAKCSIASYSRLFSFPKNETKMVIKIPKFDVVDKIEIKGLVIAAHVISDFSCPGEFNELFFKDCTFEIRKGDILAFDNSRTIFLDASELERPISSIFLIAERDNILGDICPEFEGEKITIYLKKRLYDLYYKFKDIDNGVFRRYVTAIVVYPVLVEAIALVQKSNRCEEYDSFEKDNYRDYRWFRAIEHKVEDPKMNLNLQEESAVSLADRLLGGISLEALETFKEILFNEMNSGETQNLGEIN